MFAWVRDSVYPPHTLSISLPLVTVCCDARVGLCVGSLS